MTYRFNPFDKQDYSKFAFKKSELLGILQTIDNSFSFDTTVSSEPMREAIEMGKIENQLPLHIKILAMNDYFTIVESACFISFDEPEKIQAYIDSGDFTYDAWRYGEHIQAVKVIENGIRASNLDIENDGMIPRASLQQFLYERNHIITGFNDNQPRYACPTVGYASPEGYQKERAQLLKEFEQLESALDQEKKQSSLLILDCQTSQSAIEKLKQENKGLKTELLEKDQKIKELELIQTTADESKLGNTRAENNVTKLLLVLAKMADIDVNKPHAIHESLLAQADLLGLDKFPSDETVKKWLIKANNHINN